MSAVILNPQKTDVLVLRFTREALDSLIDLMNKAELESPAYPGSKMKFMLKENAEVGKSEISAELMCQLAIPVADEVVSEED